MCGICGLLGRDAPDPGLVERMNASIVHRGPDHGAVAPFGRAVLGYRRLAIVDLNTGDQPVASERGDVVAVFNGEIYNFRELRAELEARATTIRGTGDSPLIPHAYEEWGLDFVRAPRGHVRDRALGSRGATARAGARPPRQEAAPLRAAPRRLARVRVRDEGAAAAPELPRELDLRRSSTRTSRSQYVPRSGLRAVEKVPPGSYASPRGRRCASSATGRPRRPCRTAGRERRGSSACATR